MDNNNLAKHIETNMPSYKNMTPDEKRAYKLRAYHKNKEAYNLAKIAKGLLAKERKVRVDTIEKYKLKKKDDNTYIIPRKSKLKIDYDNVRAEAPPPVINVVVENTPSNIENYDLANNLCNGKQYKDWVATKLSKMPKRVGGDEVRGKREIQEYFKIPDLLFKLHKTTYDENKDFSPWVKNSTELLQLVDTVSTWKSPGTKSKFLGRILFIMKMFPPLQHRVSKDVYTIYDNQYNKYEGLAKAIQRKRTTETPIFNWNVIKDYVKKEYGVYSYEYLLIALYDEMIARDDFQLNMAYHGNEMTDPKKNYLLLERSKKICAIYMNSFKTVGRYGKLVYQLSPSLMKIIEKLHPIDEAKFLFPFQENKLSEFLIKTLRKIDLFKNEPGLGVKYLRHSLVSTKLYQIKKNDPDYADKVSALADQAMHSVKMQDTYTSPLKGATGKVIHKYSDQDADFETDLKFRFELPDEDIDDNANLNKSLIGVEVGKLFYPTQKSRTLKMFYGKVVDLVGGYYRVIFSDGDIEDMTEKQVREYMKNKKKMI